MEYSAKEGESIMKLCNLLEALSSFSITLCNQDQMSQVSIDVAKEIEIDEITLDLDECQSYENSSQSARSQSARSQNFLWIARKSWYGNQNQQIKMALSIGSIKAILMSEDQSLKDLMASASEAEREKLCNCPIYYCPTEDPLLAKLSAHFYGYPSQSLKVYGVTGTNGKTSTTYFLKRALENLGERVALMGTVAYRFEDQVLNASNTTPDALMIQRFAKEALDLGATALVLEVSSHALALQRVACLSFDAVGFCNLGRDHLDFHQTIEAYRLAKASLAQQYAEASVNSGKSTVAVAHLDQEGLFFLGNRSTVVDGLVVSLSKTDHQSDQSDQSDQQINQIVSKRFDVSCVQASSLKGFSLKFAYQGVDLGVYFFSLIADYQQENLALALAMLMPSLQKRTEDSQQPLKSLFAKMLSGFDQEKGVCGRMEWVVSQGEPFKIALVDYAHTADALERALCSLRALHDLPQWVVFGCGGNRDKGKRPLMLKVALENADRVFLTADNPRFEKIEEIIADSLSYLDECSEDEREKAYDRIHIIHHRVTAIDEAWRNLPTGALLVAGKGHEDYQEIQGVFYELSDQEVLRQSQMNLNQSHGLDHQGKVESVYSNLLNAPLKEKSSKSQRLPHLSKR
jgi:UDP-N-acetylmuramoyl-L-alanyl-D-glutamate--2,6-diaminopimelate ligase